MATQKTWESFKAASFYDQTLGFFLDLSLVSFPAGYLKSYSSRLTQALDAMRALESGEIANPDEKRMVGHYWLRKPSLSPNAEIKESIESTFRQIKSFSQDIHSGKIHPPSAGKFKYALIIGIGGSALGPQFVGHALGTSSDKIKLYFFDNTDPDGMARTISSIPSLKECLCVVISKSGGTKETRNGQLVAKEYYQSNNLNFSEHAVAVTGEGSELDLTASSENWLSRFPMWDWVGGRTSEFSAVGLLPAALQGLDVDGMLKGAGIMDELTRNQEVAKNPALLLAASWFHLSRGRGEKAMVVLPYRDRLELISKYLQQLVMESLGKELDLNGQTVHQGLTVFGNKGSTDQHAYVQQLRDGVNNFFAVFIEVMKDDYSQKSLASSLQVEAGVTPGDYLFGFCRGTASALAENNRESITITVDALTPQTLGALIALFERAVGFYASLININAYHQPGVEAGKKAAAKVLALRQIVLSHLKNSSTALTVEELARLADATDQTPLIFKILRHMQVNGKLSCEQSAGIFESRWKLLP